MVKFIGLGVVVWLFVMFGLIVFGVIVVVVFVVVLVVVVFVWWCFCWCLVLVRLLLWVCGVVEFIVCM